MTVLIYIHICLIHPGICDQSSSYTWTLWCLASRLVAGWKIYMCTGFLRAQNSASPPTLPVLVEKVMGGVRVNIDAHSVPSQPQSIWNHSSLWRTNNLEETLIITHPFTLQNLLEASSSPLFSSSYTSPSLHLVKLFFFLPSALLSFLLFIHFDLRFLYVFPVTPDELWINIGDAHTTRDVLSLHTAFCPEWDDTVI